MDQTSLGARHSGRLGTTVTLAALLVGGGCVPRERRLDVSVDTPVGTSAAHTRRFGPELSDTAWVATVADAEGNTPALLATDGRHVYVGDPTAANVVALDASTGQRRWETRRSSDSAVSRVRPIALFARRGSGVLVVTDDDGELVTLSSAGRLERRLRIQPPGPIECACELPDGQLLVSLLAANSGLLTVDGDGRVRAVHELPWPDLRRASGLLSATRLAPTRDGCLTALALGRGFALFDGRRFARPVPYVEQLELPEIRRVESVKGNATTISTFLSERVGGPLDFVTTNTAIVTSFGGHTDDRNHLVDLYAPDGRYRESFRTSRAVSALAATENQLFILTHRAGEPIVVALRWPASVARSNPAQP